MGKLLLRIAIIWAIALVHADAYKIFMAAGGSKSHKNAFDAVAEELGKRGHEVSVFSSIKDEKKVKGVTNVHLTGEAGAMKPEDFNFFHGTIEESGFLDSMIKIFVSMCNGTYHNPSIQDILNNPNDADGNPKFDVVIVDAVFGEFMLPIAHVLKVPAIHLSPSLLFPSIAWRMNIPYPYSYLFSGMDENINPESIVDRAMNAGKILGFRYFREYQMQPAWDELLQTIIPGVPTIAELERQVAFAMINSHTAVHPSAPRMPYFVDVGCLNCKDRKPLPADLEDFMNNSPDGVVYFSLGSFTQGEHMPVDMRDKLITAFSKIKQNVLFKYETTIEGLPANVKQTTWVPQADLLGHPKMRLFITHGGGLSMMESAYNACPQLAFPLSAEQHSNMASAKAKGFAEILDWKTFTLEELEDKLTRILNNQSYAENAAKVSKLLKDNPIDPREKAAYWVEYVIRHNGAPHLKSGAEHLNFFQYFLIDVIGALILALVTILSIIFVILRAVYRLVFVKKDAKKSKLKTK